MKWVIKCKSSLLYCVKGSQKLRCITRNEYMSSKNIEVNHYISLFLLISRRANCSPERPQENKKIICAFATFVSRRAISEHWQSQENNSVLSSIFKKISPDSPMWKRHFKIQEYLYERTYCKMFVEISCILPSVEPIW